MYEMWHKLSERQTKSQSETETDRQTDRQTYLDAPVLDEGDSDDAEDAGRCRPQRRVVAEFTENGSQIGLTEHTYR